MPPEPQPFQMMIGDASTTEPRLQLCGDHFQEIVTVLTSLGVGDRILKTGDELEAALKGGRSDPVLDVSKVLFSIVLQAMGAEAALQFQCPVCAFRKFDFVGELSKIMAPRYLNPPEPSLILVPPSRPILQS